MNIPLLMLASYLFLTILIGVIFLKKRQDAGQFMAAQNGLGAWLLVPLLFSELIAGAGTIGNAAAAFQLGLSSVWSNWGMVIGCFLFIATTLRVYKAMNYKYGVISVPETYGRLFDKRCQSVLLVTIVVVYGILYSLQPVAAAAIIAPMIHVNEKLVTWVVSILFIAIALAGGMKGIARMNILHAVIMYMGLLLAAWGCIKMSGGFSAMKEALPETYYSFTRPNLQTAAANALGTAISFLASASVVSVAVCAKSYGAAKRGIMTGAVLVTPFALLPALIGLAGKVMMPESEASNILFAMADQLGPVYAGLVSMAIVAAIWSTGPALLLIVSTAVMRDLLSHGLGKSTDRQQLLYSKIAVVVIGCVATCFGIGAGSILDQMYGAFQIRSIVGIVLMAAIIWPRVNSDSAFWGMLSGGIVAAAWFFMKSPLGIAPLWPGMLVCLGVLIPMTLKNTEKYSDCYRRYEEAAAEMESDVQAQKR